MSEIKRFNWMGEEMQEGVVMFYKDHAAEVKMLNTKIASLRETIDELTLYQAQRDGYARQRVELAAKDAEIAALTKALDEATMLLHEFQTDCGWDTTLERDFANIKTPASRALCERLFGGAK